MAGIPIPIEVFSHINMQFSFKITGLPLELVLTVLSLVYLSTSEGAQ